jgi:MFS family permease
LHLALFSGLNDTIVYDSLLEINKNRAGFEKWFGYTRLINSVALVLGSLIGGIVANHFGLRSAYLWSLPSCLLGIGASLLIKEPVTHTESETTYLLHHIKDTFRQVWRKDVVGWVVLSAVSVGALLMFLLEIDQLWLIALALPLLWYGPVNALLLIGYGLSAPIANKMVDVRWLAKLLCVIGLGAVVLLTIQNVQLVIVGQVVAITIFSALQIVASGKLHDAMPSKYRAGAASMVSTFTTIIFLPLSFIFGRLSQSVNISVASYLLIPVALVGILSFRHSVREKV